MMFYNSNRFRVYVQYHIFYMVVYIWNAVTVLCGQLDCDDGTLYCDDGHL